MTIDPSYWPISGPDQDVYVSNLAKQVAKLRHTVKPIVVHKFFEPVQADWEQAWSLKTGLYPPISPGVKLLWYNLSSGEMEYFTTVWNLGNGTDYDGTVYPVKPSTQDTSYFRFLGNLSRRGTLVSAFSKPDTTITTLFIDPRKWIKQGLIRLFIEFSLVITTSNLTLKLSQGNAIYSNDYQVKDYPPAITPTVVILSTNWTPPNTLQSTLKKQAPVTGEVSIREYLTGSLAEPPLSYPFVGQLELSFGLSAEDEKQYFGSISSWAAAIFGSPSATEIKLYQGAWTRRVATLPGRDYLFMSEISDYGMPENSHDDDRAWVYGLFDTPPESDPGEY